jgi:hypothetical protein
MRKMTHRSTHLAVLVLLTLALGDSRAAFAQTDRPLQLGAGYQFLHQSVERGGNNFPAGVYVGIEQAFKSDQVKAWGWMGQFEAGFRSDSGFSEQIYTFLGGIRLASTKPLRWTPSGFGLIGVGTANASCTEFCGGTNSGVAVQGGFAMTTHLKDSTLLDVAFKATKLKIDGVGLFNATVAAGVRFNLRK